MLLRWPRGFERFHEGDWTAGSVDEFALRYDAVKNHGWYRNLDPTLEQASRHLKEDDLLLDYSGGTGIFVERLLERTPGIRFGIVIVDSSPKFLRLALEKFRSNERVGLRLIRYLKDKKRLQYVDEVMDLRFNSVVSTNAIHLYYDLKETLKSWFRISKPGSKVFIQSGNIRNANAKQGEWIIDETVEAIHNAAVEIVLRDERLKSHRRILKDEKKMNEYAKLRQKYFLQPRPLEFYREELQKAGFVNLKTSSKTIEVLVSEWIEFLSVYHEGALGWVGGSEKVEGKPPELESVRDRLALLTEAARKVFEGKSAFSCCWSYIACDVPNP